MSDSDVFCRFSIFNIKLHLLLNTAHFFACPSLTRITRVMYVFYIPTTVIFISNVHWLDYSLGLHFCEKQNLFNAKFNLQYFKVFYEFDIFMHCAVQQWFSSWGAQDGSRGGTYFLVFYEI